MPEQSETTFGRYRLLERLGEGGMAEVFKAKSFGVEGFEKVLVIKRILPKLAAHPRFVDLFVHEAKLAVRLSHANIVQVFDLGKVEREEKAASYFIAMEYVPGLDLATALSRARRSKMTVPLGMSVYVAAEVAKALDHAHRRRDDQARPLGIVHRDISPQNVLVSWEGEVKVTDFGIAKAKDSLEPEADPAAGKVHGKLSYMSPEQSKGEAVDGRSDLFSLGTVLYEMIAGSHPFSAPTSFETLRRLQACEFPPLEILRPDCPLALTEIVGKLLAKEADARFPDAARLHEALLGYFYASGERFGATRLADFVEAFHERHSTPEMETAGVFDERHGANERTPVEVPSPSSTGKTGGIPMISLRTPIGERLTTGAIKAVEIGERREVTALALWFQSEGRSVDGNSAPPPSDTARSVIERYGGKMLERDGSYLVALFGLGDADGRDTHAAARAALVSVRARSGSGAVSAGVHAARVLVDASGEPVHDERLTSLVSEAQALARASEGQVVASIIAARVIRSDFAVEDLPNAGRAAPEGARIITSGRGQTTMPGRFIGRQNELRRLGDILAAATRRKPQLITLSGDKGVGKTRLILEMERRLQKGNYNVGFYVAASEKNGADVPWSGLTAMLHVLCGVQEGDDEAKIREIVPRLRALGLQADESDAVLAQLGATPENPSTATPRDPSGALRSGFARMLQSLTDDRLHILVWDDAHALDSASLGAILAAVERGRAREASGLRAVIVFSTREAPDAAVAADASHHPLTVNELAEDDAARLISARIGARLLPPELLSFCRERAGGHPLFLEELLRELGDSGAVTVLNGEVKTRLDGATAVPRTLRMLISARVSRLESGERAAMQAAAILGEPIFLPVLAALLKQSLPQVDKTVAALASRDLLRVTGPAQGAFASPTHGEIVLDAIPPEARRELHAAAASAYDAAFGDSGEVAERVARHLYEAGDRDRAAGAYAKAARERLRVNQLELAIRWFVRALDLAALDRRPCEEVAGWLRALGDAATRVRIAANLGDVAGPALRRIDQAGSLDDRVNARVDLARGFGAINLFDDAQKRIDEALQLAGDRGDLRQRALLVEVETAARSGDFMRAIGAATRAEALGALRDPRILISLAHARATQGDQKSALKALDQAGELVDPNDLDLALEREKVRVLVYLYTGAFQAAVDASSLAVDLARALGARFNLAAVLHNLGDASRRAGQNERAYASLTESKDICSEAGFERLTMLNRAHLAYLEGLNGDAAAEAVLRQLIGYAESRGYHTDALESRVLLGGILRRQKRVDEARRELDEVLRRAIALGNRLIAEDARHEMSKT